MFRLDQHIQILLLNHDCVVIPGFGGFVAHHMPAHIADNGRIMLPPTRTVGFNQSLTVNDSLLIQSYVDAYDLSYPEAQTMLEDEVEEMRRNLFACGSFVVNSIGTLTAQTNGTISFQPVEAGLLTPCFYGLSDISLLDINSFRTKDTNVVSIFENTSELSTQSSGSEPDNIIRIHTSTLKKIAASIAAIVVLAIAVPLAQHYDSSAIMSIFGFPSNNINKVENVEKVKKVESVKKVEKVKKAEKVVSNPLATLPEGCPKAERTATEPLPYTIVLAAKLSTKHANRYVEQLHKQGYTEARAIGKGRNHKVVYGSYSSEKEALSARHKDLKDKEFAEAWILKQKNV